MEKFKNIDALCHMLEGYAETATDGNDNPIYYELLPIIQEIRDISTPFYLKIYWKIKGLYYDLRVKFGLDEPDDMPF